MTYGFNLDWQELPENLREQKISDYISYLKSVGDPLDYVGDPREKIEQMIAAHFPIYF